jgi:hypothetical protein
LWKRAEGNTAGGAIASRRRTPRGRRIRACTKIFMHENREIPRSPVLKVGRAVRGRSRP